MEWDKPKFVILTPAGFIEAGIEEPNASVLISIEVPAFDFHKTAKYIYKQTHDMGDLFQRGRTLWETAMQNRIVSEVRIFTDNIESGLFAGADFNNDPTFPFLFAKLLSCKLHDKVSEIFMNFTDGF